jgi:hypothetical protein
LKAEWKKAKWAWTDIVPRFFIWPTFQGHIGQKLSECISRPRFVTTGAIDLKLVHIYPYVRSPRKPNVGSIWFMVWPPGGHTQKVQLLLNKSNGWIISKCLGTSSKDTLPDTWVFDLIYFSKSQRSNAFFHSGKCRYPFICQHTRYF